jgi:hypothetical protein
MTFSSGEILTHSCSFLVRSQALPHQHYFLLLVILFGLSQFHPNIESADSKICDTFMTAVTSSSCPQTILFQAYKGQWSNTLRFSRNRLKLYASFLKRALNESNEDSLVYCTTPYRKLSKIVIIKKKFGLCKDHYYCLFKRDGCDHKPSLSII